MALVDTHTHIQMPQFERDREAVIEAALAAAVEMMVVPGVDVATSEAAITLAASYPGHIFAAVGTHPHDAETLTDDALNRERALAGQDGVVAIGEIGLDYFRDLAPRDAQRDALIAQIALARELALPIILHNRESHDDLLTILREHARDVAGVFHCFIGDRDMARGALDLGFYLSFAGPLTYPKNETLREVAAWAPLDRILVETDSPYLAPQSIRGKRNEPRHVAEVVARLAALRDMPLDALAAQTTYNATTLFRLDPAIRLKGD